jgi:pimeloyl-ACP methyl ester carboxylesterase
LQEAKGPEQIAALGSSMGGASVAYAARLDERIDAVVLDSTHATLSSAIIARIDLAGYPLSVPGSWAVLFGGLLRTGLDVTQADAITSVTRLGERPLLVIGAGSDTAMGPNDAHQIAAAAAEAGVDVELRECAPALHAGSITECPAEFRDWVLGFLARALGPAG